MVAIFCLFTAAVLVAGAVLPMYTDRDGDTADQAWSVVSIAGSALSILVGAERPDTDSPGVQALFIAGFLGLNLIIVLLLVVVFPWAVIGRVSRNQVRFARIIVWLGLVGSVVPVLLSLVASGSTDSEAGWGGAVLFVGMAASLVIVLTTVRRGLRVTAPRRPMEGGEARTAVARLLTGTVGRSFRSRECPSDLSARGTSAHKCGLPQLPSPSQVTDDGRVASRGMSLRPVPTATDPLT